MQTPICPACGCSLVRLGIKFQDAVSTTYQNKEFKFCCESCLELFLASPEPLLAETKNLVVCPVCLAEKPHESTIRREIHGMDIFFCRCPACLALFEKNADYYLMRLSGKADYSGVFSHKERCCSTNISEK